MKRKKHSPEQIIRKLRQAEAMQSDGKSAGALQPVVGWILACGPAVRLCRCTARKPAIVYKAGRIAAGAHAAGSHTGAMAGEDAVYQAAFDQCGMIRVSCLGDLLSTAELLGVSVQRMIDPLGGCGLELIVGVKRDATFGPFVLAGATRSPTSP